VRNPLAGGAETAWDALREVRVHPLRSMLTLSGIVFGCASLVAMISLAGAMKRMATDDLRDIGMPRSFSAQDRAPRPDVERAEDLRHPGLRIRDLEALRRVPGVQSVHGVARAGRAIVAGPKARLTVPIEAVDAGYTELRNMDIVEGRSLRPLDVMNHARVAVVGSELIRELFGATPPVGQRIKVDGVRFLVVGVVGPIKVTFIPADFSFIARRIYIPYSHVTRYARQSGRIDAALVTAEREEEVGAVLGRGIALLRQRHGGVEDFEIENEAADVQEDLAMADGILGGWNVVMFAIAGITLLVGGIGLFSVLLISVRERVREIGIRKALGADDATILRLFLAESLTLAVLGALLGVGGGSALLILTEVIAARFGKPFLIPINVPAVLLAVGFAVAAGLVFGWYPARRAARLDPIQAISEV